MTENLAQSALDTPADNLLPFPALSAASAASQPKLYTAEELKIHFTPGASTYRTVRDLVGKVREAYHWLPEIEFKHGDNYTEFCFEQIKAMKDSPLHQKQWIAEVQRQKPNEQHETSSLAICEPSSDSIFGGLAIISKASEKREVLKGELVTQEQSNDASWADFGTLMNELQFETIRPLA